MNWAIVATSFLTCLIAELGDKTQLAVLSLTASSKSPWSVLLGSTLGLFGASILGVLAGRWLMAFLPPQIIERGSAILFIVIGLWMLIKR